MLFPPTDAPVRADDAAAAPGVFTDMSLLPRELDPFESDWPWLGWQGPDSEALIAWTLGSTTFELDVQRALAIFDEG